MTKRSYRCCLLKPLKFDFFAVCVLKGATACRFNYVQVHVVAISYVQVHIPLNEEHFMQVLDFAAFPKPEFDLPIFCANFFTAAKMNIIVL